MNPEESIGPYQILAPLGQGGMGVVYRARHQETGQLVALKTVRVPAEGLLQSIRREIQALARLQHPGIVHILEEGLHNGLPYYTMELVEGLTLKRWVRRLLSSSEDAPEEKEATQQQQLSSLTRFDDDALETQARTQHLAREDETKTRLTQGTPTRERFSSEAQALLPQPLPPRSSSGSLSTESASWVSTPRVWTRSKLSSLLLVIKKLCAPLAYLHSEGLVHSDLKPDNVLVTPDGSPIIVDFGLTSPFSGKSSREILGAGLEGKGTLHYMPPEQIMGELIDARADLFALGCILYQLLSGRPPFSGETVGEVLHKLLKEPPQPLSSEIPGVPPALDEVLRRLLAKAPKARLGYADTLAASLSRLLNEDDTPSERLRTYLYRPGLSGRREAQSALSAALYYVKRSEGGCLLIGGESGVGKTRLAMEVAKDAAAQGIRVITGGCQSAAPSPLGGLRAPLEYIADRCRAKGEEETAFLLGERASLLADYEPSLRGLPGQARTPALRDERPPKEARLQLFRALTETFLALSEEKPLLLILDDIQWADELLLGWLGSLLQSEGLPESRILLLLLYRSEEVNEGVLALLQSRAQRLLLERLGLPAVSQIVADMLAMEDPPRLFCEFLLKSSEGNPFFIAEYLRLAVSEELLWRDESGRWQIFGVDDEETSRAAYEGLPLPRSLRELVSRRLSMLPEDALLVARAASVLGRTIRTPLLGPLTGLGDASLLRALEELRRREVIEGARGGQELRFSHDKLHEICYERLTKEEKIKFHYRAAFHMERLFSEQREELSLALAKHWEEAQEGERAEVYYLMGARLMKQRYAHEEAERLYRAFFRLQDIPPTSDESLKESARAHHELGEIFQTIGRMEDARAEHAQALSIAQSIGSVRLQAESQRRLGEVYWLTGALEEAKQSFSSAVLMAKQAPDRRLEGMALYNLAVIMRLLGQVDEALRSFDEALSINREVQNRRFEGLTLNSIAVTLQSRGQIQEAMALYEEALTIHREVGNRHHEGVTLGNLANLYGVHQDRLEDAYALYQQVLQIHREMGNRRAESIALSHIADVHCKRGEIEAAEQHYQGALAIFREINDRSNVGHMLQAIADFYRLSHKDLAASEALLDESEEILRSIGEPHRIAQLLCVRAHVALARGVVAKEVIAEVEEIAQKTAVSEASELSRDLKKLRRAVDSFVAGEYRLLCVGERIEDLPEGLRGYLAEQGLLPKVLG